LKMMNRFLIRDNTHTPLPENFSTLISDIQSQGKKPFVLLNTGSYCPVHKAHVEFLLKMKTFLESDFDITVIGVYISPSNDMYVSSKAEGHGFADHFIPFTERCELIQMTIDNYKKEGNIFVDKWEGSHEEFIDFPTVWVQTQIYFDSKCQELGFKEGTVQVAYCVGSDMLKTSIDKHHRTLGSGGKVYDLPLAICGRKSGNGARADEKMKVYQNYKKEDMLKNKLFFMENNDEGISSTLIRTLIEEENKISLYQIMDQNAANFILKKFTKKEKPKSKPGQCW